MPGESTRLVATGDWFASGRIPDSTRFAPDTAAVFEELRSADIAFVNLETPITTRGIRAEKQNTLRADPSVVEDLLAAGIDLVSLANNHMLDYGLDGLTDTLDCLERAGIPQVGAGENLESSRRPVVLNSRGGTIGFLAFASTLPQGFAAASHRPGIAPIHVTTAFVVENPLAMEQPGTPPPVITTPLKMDLDATVDAVRSLKAQVQFVVVSPHWGVAGQDAIMDYEYEVGHALVDAGADIILGHHPHRLHGVEFYRGKPILYSAGNFVFEPLPIAGNSPWLSFRGRMTAANVYGVMRKEGVLVEAHVRGSELQSLSLLPVMLDTAGYPTLRCESAGQFASLLSELSMGLGTNFQVRDGRINAIPA